MSLKDVCNQGSLTDIPSNSIPCNAVISVNRKTVAAILSRARASCSVAVLAAGGVFRSKNPGLQKVFFDIYFSSNGNAQKIPVGTNLSKTLNVSVASLEMGNR